jgi:protein gp37
MGQDSAIAWTNHTFNPWWGCHKNSAECANCYAEAWAKRTGFDIWGKGAPRRQFSESHWDDPLLWDAAAKREGVRKRVFCGSMCDIMEPREDLNPQRARLAELVERTPNLDWLLLTKFPQHFRDFLPQAWLRDPRQNVWGMTTAGCDDSLWRVSELLATPFVLRGLSAEPLISELGLDCVPWPRGWERSPDDGSDGIDALSYCGRLGRSLDWVIPGHESGPGARDGSIDDILHLVRGCKAAGTACFVKQVQLVRDGKRYLSKNPAEWPAAIRVQQFPEVRRG